MVTKEIAVQLGFLLPFLEYPVSTASVWAEDLPLQPPHAHTRGTEPATFRFQNKRNSFNLTQRTSTDAAVTEKVLPKCVTFITSILS